MNWTKKTPSEPGWYWCRQYGRPRIVNVWIRKYDEKICTNEDGGAFIDDLELYEPSTTVWYGPIDESPPYCDYCDEEGEIETDNNGPIGPCPICGGTKNLI